MPNPPPAATDASPAVSVVLCTFNRAEQLEGALAALLDQGPETPAYEVLVVDNNSTDHTRGIAAAFAARGPVRYVHEPRQGLAFARNRGVEHARAPLVAFTDDDVRVDQQWVREVARAFAAAPDRAFLGGKVVPDWEAAPPGWLADAGVAPLALADYGDAARDVDPAAPVCLVGANLCVRRSALAAVGGFSPLVQRVGDGIGSTEDHELQLRLLAAGLRGRYEPALVVRAQVPAVRLQRRYHRAWHAGHGRYVALMREPAFERSRWRILGVPAHVLRACGREAVAFIADALRLRTAAAFAHELRLRFLLGFARQRLSERRHG